MKYAFVGMLSEVLFAELVLFLFAQKPPLGVYTLTALQNCRDNLNVYQVALFVFC